MSASTRRLSGTGGSPGPASPDHSPMPVAVRAGRVLLREAGGTVRRQKADGRYTHGEMDSSRCLSDRRHAGLLAANVGVHIWNALVSAGVFAPPACLTAAPLTGSQEVIGLSDLSGG